ncbi:MAG: hypothetical protein ACT6XY_09995 [Phreatobacter sp.]|uniref:hypothetical protein n=1 Tax=Phreatobacter sp. TaxID=1966341 RepID=UPI0040365F93
MAITRRDVLVGTGGLAGALGLYGGWRLLVPSGTLRYRLTVEVEVDGEIRTGTSVGEATYTSMRRLPFLLIPPFVSDLKAEATVVDLGPRGLLFVLIDRLTHPPGYRTVASNYLAAIIPWAFGFGEETIRSISSLNKTVDLAGDLLPPMIKFGSHLVPESAQFVDPNNLERSFGPNVRLRRVRLATTHEPITNQIEKVLPWLPGWQGTVNHNAWIGGVPVLRSPNLGRVHFTQGLPSALDRIFSFRG